MFRFSAPQPAGFFTLGEGNGNPLQYSCLEYPMDRGAWWATVHGSQRVGHDWATSLHFSPLGWPKWPFLRGPSQKGVIIFHWLLLQHMSLLGSVPEDYLCSRHVFSLSVVAVFLALFDNIIFLLSVFDVLNIVMLNYYEGVFFLILLLFGILFLFLFSKSLSFFYCPSMVTSLFLHLSLLGSPDFVYNKNS